MDSLFEFSQGLKFTLASGKYLRNYAAVEAILLAISTLLTFELAFINSYVFFFENDIIFFNLHINYFFF